MKSPLRYPGGKSRPVKLIAQYIPDTDICSPFLGGGSVELYLQETRKVYAYDAFYPLVAFWQELLESKPRLVATVRKMFPIIPEEFAALQRICLGLDKPSMAAVFFVLNRCSYSGTTLSGGMSPGHPRFNESAIKRLSEFSAPNLMVECMDFRSSIRHNRHRFLYLDPPNQALYGENGNKHRGFEHGELRDALVGLNWVMSYNDSAHIRDLYSGHKIIELNWSYGMSKKTSEILIFSK